MRARADIAAGLALDRRIVEQAHHAIAVADGVDEIILVDLQEARDVLEDLEAALLERRVELGERVPEVLDLGRPDIVGHMVAELMPLRQVAADVPEFLKVERRRALRGLDA